MSTKKSRRAMERELRYFHFDDQIDVDGLE
jgi:hypothetical protein